MIMVIVIKSFSAEMKSEKDDVDTMFILCMPEEKERCIKKMKRGNESQESRLPSCLVCLGIK